MKKKLLEQNLVDGIEKFKRKHGHFVVPTSHVVDTYPLGRKMQGLIRKLRTISIDRRKQLEAIGFPVDWKVYYVQNVIIPALNMYKNIHGDLWIPQKFVIQENDPMWPAITWGLRLGERVNNLRQSKKELGESIVAVLDEFGFSWDPNNDKILQLTLPALRIYKDLYGDAHVPNAFTVPSNSPHWPSNLVGYKLGHSMMVLKAKNRKGISLSDDVIHQLHELGIDLDETLAQTRWEKKILPSLKMYFDQFGHSDVEQSFIVPECDPWPKQARNLPLGRIVRDMRSIGIYADFVKRDKDHLKGIGFIWTSEERLDFTITQRVIPAIYTYKDEIGHTYIPIDFIVPAKAPWPELAHEMKLGHWVARMRLEIDELSHTLRFLLEETEIVWRQYDARFENIVLPAIKTYTELHGSCKNISSKFQVPSEAPWPEATWGLNLGGAIAFFCYQTRWLARCMVIIAAITILGHCIAAGLLAVSSNEWCQLVGIDIGYVNIMADIAVALSGGFEIYSQRLPVEIPNEVEIQSNGDNALGLMIKVPFLKAPLAALSAVVNVRATLMQLTRGIFEICLFVASFASINASSSIYYLFWIVRLVIWTFQPKCSNSQQPAEPTSAEIASVNPISNKLHRYLELSLCCQDIVIPSSTNQLVISVFTQDDTSKEYELIGTTERVEAKGVIVVFQNTIQLAYNENQVKQIKTVLYALPNAESPMIQEYEIGHHLYQYPILHGNLSIRSLGNATGFFVLPGETSDWSYFIAQLGLFFSILQLKTFAQNQLSNESIKDCVLYRFTTLTTKIFQYDLVAVIVAIFWCVSYPSYVSVGLFALALSFLAVYGLELSSFLAVMTTYAMFYASTEYFFLIPAMGLLTYYTNLNYNSTDLAVQNFCMFLLCCCHRTHRPIASAFSDDTLLPKANNHLKLFWLWTQDLKTTILRHIDKLVLLTIFVVVLSTTASLFQTGFLILATYLSLFKQHRKRLWRLLLAYTLAICFILYTWNITCPAEYQLYSIIGLTCYRKPKESTNDTQSTISLTGNTKLSSLWSSSLFNAQLLLIAQVVVQLILYNKQSKIQTLAMKSADLPLYYVSRIMLEIDRFYRVGGIIVNYIVLLAQALSWERTENNRVTLIGFIQLVFFCMLLHNHMTHFKLYPRGNSRFRRLWRLVLIFQLVVLVFRYIYQFEPLASVITDSWQISYFTMEDVGFKNLSSSSHLTALSLYLLPTCIMAALAAWQLSAMEKDIHVHPIFSTPAYKEAYRYGMSLVHYSTHNSVLMVSFTVVLAASKISVPGFIFYICAATSVTNRSSGEIWSYIFKLSLALLLVLYAYQLNIPWFTWPSIMSSAEWFGCDRLESISTSLWSIGKIPILMLVVCIIQRFATWLVPESFEPPEKVSIWASLFSTIYNRDIAFSCVMYALLISAFVHLNIISIIYMLVVRYMMIANWENNVIFLHFVRRTTMGIIVVTIVQYIILLWLPLWILSPLDAYPPWKWLQPQSQAWLFLNHQHQWSIVTDFVVLLCFSWLPQPESLTTFTMQQDKRYLTPQLWTIIHQFFANYSICFVLVFVFITGCAQFGVASGIYLGYSIYMLFHLDRSDIQWQVLLHLQTYNWFYLLVLVIYQMPWLTDKTESCVVGTHDPKEGVCLSIPNSLGLYKIGNSDNAAYNLSMSTLSILIFMFLSLQAQVFDSPAYYDVLKLHRQELERCQKRGFILNDSIAKDRILRWRYLKQEKQAAIQRLKVIVSKLVNKVEEMMDIAMGLHYSLPPVAPSRPKVIATSQNSITIHWVRPESKVHKIRSYRISRQVYPSLTLLGDFSDIIEVKSHSTTVEIKNLRPGTSYQFKVAAVSRMGEGPFSTASDPASTVTINWGDTCTGGWLRIQKHVQRTNAFLRISTYIPSLKNVKFNQRYAIVDNECLTFYKSEVVAMKHRQDIEAQRKSHRKGASQKPKTYSHFRLCHVINVDLSDQQIQLDEMSPKLYCIEITVVVPLTKSASSTTKYVFQPESANQFNSWVASLAYGVSPAAIGSRILAFQSSNHLQVPRYFFDKQSVYASSDDKFKLSKQSALSESSYRRESSHAMTQPEGPPPLTSKSLMLLKIYRLCYTLQDMALQHETRKIGSDEDMTESDVPTLAEVWFLIVHVVRSHSATFCYLTFIASFIFQADLLNIMYVLAMFVIILSENPRPSPYLWKLVLKYSFIVLLMRYLFQLPFFCQNYTINAKLYPSMQPFCPSIPLSIAALSSIPFQPLVLFGIYKYDGSANPTVKTTFSGLQWNFLIICCVLFHRRELQVRGFWMAHDPLSGNNSNDTLQNFPKWQQFWFKYIIGTKPKQASVTASANTLQLSLDTLRAIEEMDRQDGDDAEDNGSILDGKVPRINRQESLDSLNEHDFELTDFLAKRTEQAIPEEPIPLPVVCQDTRHDALADLNNHVERLLEEGTDDITALQLDPLSPSFDYDQDDSDEDDEEPTKVGNSIPNVDLVNVSDALHIESLEIPASPKNEGINTEEINPIYIAEVQHVIAKPSRFQALFGVKPPEWIEDYYKHLMPKPPVDWDKDIKKAAVGTKPGKDFTLLSVGISVLSIAYASIFFHTLGEPVINSSTSLLSSFSSGAMLSGYMVAIVFFHVAVIIWDRVSHVYSSLESKVACHYWVIFMVHLMLWIVIPNATKSYIDNQPSLLVYYLIQCCYMAVSARQIKYGYVVFRGNPLNIRKCDAFTKNFFGIYMAIPFAFEMRSLLDYICSTTALDLDMWLTLEGIAAHLFQVRLQMNNRIAEGEVLQGNRRQPMKSKLKGAGIYFVGILICLIAPLALFSTANPTTAKNPILQAVVAFGLIQTDGTFQLLYNGESNTNPEYSSPLTTVLESEVQQISFMPYSNDLWHSTPPLRRQLIQKLNSPDTIQWKMSFTFTRAAPQGQQSVTYDIVQNVTELQRKSMIAMMNVSSLSNNDISEFLTIPMFYPAVLNVGAATIPAARPPFIARTIQIQRFTEVSSGSYWVVSSLDSFAYDNQSTSDLGKNSNLISCPTEGFCLVTVSDNIVAGLNTLGIGSYGITATYVLFTIGANVKSALRGNISDILYNELPNPDDLMDLVEGIYIARKEEYVGHLKDESRLFETLIRVMRSPETLLKVTGANVIHIPNSKEKID
ncbi:hypothetical protein THRCLA_00109 [Thraustotheca clavata]|uniref:Fibronectin type-III domain-containing protein n=1 Tax=Thraustotheca clavata TaxID=74557 RepID=A0A1W0ACZ4_9STRA|nr:hypothetical protein THRCLA_00109 [Thraustotheca clavata]